MRPPPLDDDVNESFGWCCDEFFGAFSNVQFSLSIGNNFYHHTFTSSSSSAHHGEREREREREMHGTTTAGLVSTSLSPTFFSRGRRGSFGGRWRRDADARFCRLGCVELTTRKRRRRRKERIENAVSATRKMEENGGDENKSERMERGRNASGSGRGDASPSSSYRKKKNRRLNRKKRREQLQERNRSERENDVVAEGTTFPLSESNDENKAKETVIEVMSSSKESSKYGSIQETTTSISTASSRDEMAEPEVVVATDDLQQEGWAFTFPKSMDELSYTYQSAPARYKLMVCCACAFVVCNMDKINMSVAVIPMSREFSWDTAQSGILQSSFFYGFALSQIPGGFMNTKYGGARVLPFGLSFISLATLAIPFAGDNLPALFFARALVGLGEGVVPSAVTDIIARAMPVGERSRAVAFTFSGFNVGSILGLSVAPFIMEKTGWRGMFDIFGSFGALWIVIALGLFGAGGVTTNAVDEGKIPVTNLFGSRQEAEEPGKANEEITFEDVPWGQFANSDPIKALAFVHFVGNWGTYVVLAWLPTYFTEEVGLSLTNASLLTLLPPVANIAVGTLAGPTADRLIQRGTDLTLVRKGCQSVAFAAPAFAMLLSTYFEDPVATVILLTIGISFQSFSYAGLYSNHQDLSPKYASIFLGITNTCGALPGVIGVPLTGYLIKETQEWELSMFGPAIILYCLGIAVYWKWGSGKRLAFDKPKST